MRAHTERAHRRALAIRSDFKKIFISKIFSNEYRFFIKIDGLNIL